MKIIDPTIDNRWDAFVSGSEDSTVFHTSPWIKVMKDTYGYKPHCYILEDESDQIRAAIPFQFISSRLTGKRLVCSPFSDYCWPLGINPADITRLQDTAVQEVTTGEASYLEIRGGPPGMTIDSSELKAGNLYSRYLVDMGEDPAKVKDKFHNSVRRGISQAEKRGVTVRLSTEEKDMASFYTMHIATRKKLGVIPQPFDFFRNLHRHLIMKNFGFIAIGEYENRPVAGIIFLKHRDTIYYKFNASNERYLQKRPNHLATWAAIEYALENGYKYLDLGRCTPEEEGLRTYKLRWGAEEIAMPYYFFPDIRGLSNASETSMKFKLMRLMSRMAPKAVFKAAGSLLYKHLG